MRQKMLMLYLISAFLGVLVGLVGSSFRLSIDILSSFLTNLIHFLGDYGLPIGLCSGILSMLMVLAAYGAVIHWAPEASGSGVPEIEGALLHDRPIFWSRLLPVKYFFGILALSAQMILGREGPTIHIGGNLGEMLGRLFDLTRRRRDSLIAAGAAAGLAVAFNAPLAGVLFVMEEMRNQFNYSFTNFTMVVISCILATIVMDMMIGTQATIPMSLLQLPALDSLWIFALLGFVVGFAGLFFNIFLMSALDWVDSLSSRQKVVYVAVVGFIVGFLAIRFPSAAGGGMKIIEESLVFSPQFSVLCLLFILRFVGTIACYSTAVPGGIFAPMLALGTLLGLAIFQTLTFLHLGSITEPGMFAIAGMAAFFAATTRAPITAAVLIVEMTQNYSLIFALMMTCITATIVMQLARNKPIYTQLLDRSLDAAQRNQGFHS